MSIVTEANYRVETNQENKMFGSVDQICRVNNKILLCFPCTLSIQY